MTAMWPEQGKTPWDDDLKAYVDAGDAAAADSGPVESVNGDTGDVVLDAADVGAVPTSRTVNGKALTGNIALNAADVGARPSSYVPAWTEVTGKPSSFPTTAAEIADATTTGRNLLTAANVAGARTQLQVNNVDNTSDANKPVSTAQQAAINGRVPTSRTVNSQPLTADVTLDADDVGARPSDWTPGVADVPAGSVLRVLAPEAARPTPRTDVSVFWLGYATEPANAIDGDVWLQPQA